MKVFSKIHHDSEIKEYEPIHDGDHINPKAKTGGLVSVTFVKLSFLIQHLLVYELIGI